MVNSHILGNSRTMKLITSIARPYIEQANAFAPTHSRIFKEVEHTFFFFGCSNNLNQLTILDDPRLQARQAIRIHREGES